MPVDRRPPAGVRGLGRHALRRIPRLWIARLPEPMALPLLHHRNDGRSDVRDVQTTEVDPVMIIQSYWLRIGGDAGPAASVYYRGREGLRLDLLARNPHVHLHQCQEFRLPGPPRRLPFETRATDGPTRICAELEHRLAASLARDARRRIRNHRPDPTELERALEQTHRHLGVIVERHDAPVST